MKAPRRISGGLWWVLGLAACGPALGWEPRVHQGAAVFSIPTGAPSASEEVFVDGGTPGSGAALAGAPALAASAPGTPRAGASGAVAGVLEPPADAALERTARQLAGLSTETSHPGRRERLAQHARAANASFEAFEASRGKAMLGWSKGRLLAAERGTVLYPFAGPDLVTARRFYPAAGRYVLVALQEGGPPPELSTLREGELDATLDLYERVFDAFSRRGFFLTMHLGAGYRTPRSAQGISGVLLAFAEREGLQVIAAEPVRLRSDGELERHPGALDARETWSSLRLHLRRREDGERVLVDYVQLDLSDAGLTRDPAARAFLGSLAAGPVVLKAASHLLQQRGFHHLRDLLLERASQVIQDETGLAYKLLEGPFEVKLFGSFKGVNGLFDGRPQRALQEAYASRSDVEPLPFGIGYRKAAGSALMVATRRGAGASRAP